MSTRTGISPSKSDKYDDRPLISDLLTEHASTIKSVREIIQDDESGKRLLQKSGNSERYDDIWILRYILSHKGNRTSAAKAALKTMQFRDERKLNELGDIRHRIQNKGDPEDAKRFSNNNMNTSENMSMKSKMPMPMPIERLPGNELFESCCGQNALSYTQPDDQRGTFVFVDCGKIDMDRIPQIMTKETMLEFYIYKNEAAFQVLDAVTRSTGRLTKEARIVDMGDVKLRNMNRVYLKQDAACNKEVEDYFPQLLGTMFVANSPSWLASIWSLLRPLFPKRFVAKVDFLPPTSKINKLGSKNNMHSNRNSILRPVLRYISEEDLPERYGGKNQQWPLPCVGSKYSAPQ